MCLASMGNYIFNKQVLLEALEQDETIKESSHDFGKNVIPMLLAQGKEIFIYNFADNTFPGMSDTERGYWRDVGSIDAYWQAIWNLLNYNRLNLYSKDWPLRTFNYNYPPQNLSGKKVTELVWLLTPWYLKAVLFLAEDYQDVFCRLKFV